MASRWIVKRGEKQAGPFSSPQLRGLALSGQLRPTDLVTRQGSNRFVNADQVKGLEFPEAMEQDAEEMVFGTVEIIEDEEPVIIAESDEVPVIVAESDEVPVMIAESDEEAVIVVPAVEEPRIVDYDYDTNDNEAEELAPLRRDVPPVRSRGLRRSSRSEPARNSMPAGRKTYEDEETGYAAWIYLFAGVVCLATGIGLNFIIDYAIGGRLIVISIFSVAALQCFYGAFKKLKKRKRY